MGTKPNGNTKDAFDLILRYRSKGMNMTAKEAADIFNIHVTTLYRYKPYQDWRKSMKGNKQ